MKADSIWRRHEKLSIYTDYFTVSEFCPDLILSDYDLPQYNGALALAEAKKRLPKVPFILVTGELREDEATIRNILANGASDCVSKNCLELLPPAIHKALSNQS